MKTLDLNLESCAHVTANNLTVSEAHSALRNIFSQLEGVTRLNVHGTYDILQDAPARFFESLKTLCISRPVSSVNGTIAILSHCPNVTYLNVGGVPGNPEVTFPATTMPHLTRLQAPIELAMVLVPGRPIRDLRVTMSGMPRSRHSCGSGDLAPIIGGLKALRCLRIDAFQWKEGSIDEIANLAPSLEILELRVVGERMVSDVSFRSPSHD